MAGSPWRDDPGTTPPAGLRRCPVCPSLFVPKGRQVYCSSPCRKRLFRARHAGAAPVAVPVGATRRRHTVYECGECGARRLGVQRCEDCGTFARAAGLGGDCPHCGQMVTVAELGLDQERGR